MLERECPKCGERLKELPDSYALLAGQDVPAFGSKTEIMVTPRNTLRVRAYRCENPACMYVEFYAA